MKVSRRVPAVCSTACAPAPAVADDPFTFMISGGCCGGTSPVLCRRSNIIEGFDVQIGAVTDVPVYAHPDHARYSVRDRFVIDAIDDVRSATFSLEIPYGAGFVLRELPDSPEA